MEDLQKNIYLVYQNDTTNIKYITDTVFNLQKDNFVLGNNININGTLKLFDINNAKLISFNKNQNSNTYKWDIQYDPTNTIYDLLWTCYLNNSSAEIFRLNGDPYNILGSTVNGHMTVGNTNASNIIVNNTSNISGNLNIKNSPNTLPILTVNNINNTNILKLISGKLTVTDTSTITNDLTIGITSNTDECAVTNTINITEDIQINSQNNLLCLKINNDATSTGTVNIGNDTQLVTITGNVESSKDSSITPSELKVQTLTVDTVTINNNTITCKNSTINGTLSAPNVKIKNSIIFSQPLSQSNFDKLKPGYFYNKGLGTYMHYVMFANNEDNIVFTNVIFTPENFRFNPAKFDLDYDYINIKISQKIYYIDTTYGKRTRARNFSTNSLSTQPHIDWDWKDGWYPAF
jgi:hypothetical protein